MHVFCCRNSIQKCNDPSQSSFYRMNGLWVGVVCGGALEKQERKQECKKTKQKRCNITNLL